MRSDADIAIFKLCQERRAQPFAWGVRDCLTWAADSLHAWTGRDIAADVRGRYHSAATAAELLRHVGGLRALAMRAGQHVSRLEDMQTGDVVLVRREFQQLCAPDEEGIGAIAVFWRGNLVGQGAAGLGYLLPAAALAAWRPVL